MTGQRMNAGRRWSATRFSLLLIMLATVATGCAAEEHRGEPEFASGAMPGLNRRVGDVLLRDVVVQQPRSGEEIPVGGTAQLTLIVLNQGTRPDALVDVSTPAARSTAILSERGDGAGFEPVPSLPIAPSATPPVGPPGFPYYVELRDLTRALRVGESLDVTFRFTDAGSVNMEVPVAVPGRATGSPVTDG